MTRLTLILACLVQTLAVLPAASHELRPAYLDMREIATDQFAIVWKVPAIGERRLSLHVQLPDACKSQVESIGTIEGNAYFERWHVSCRGGIKGREAKIVGLRSTLTDVLARIEYMGGTTQVSRLTPETPSLVFTGVQSRAEVGQTYLALGVDHILTGFDHLLFVLALILLIDDRIMLVKTITAFTVAHSITLAGSSLGYFSLPQRPVEATIALSIAFVASELVRSRSSERRFSENYPWMIAFAFGLLHGFGFAGALKEIGLPQTDVPLALLTFNIGVEVGQLIFVAAILLGFMAVRALVDPITAGRTATAYVIGTVSTYWLISRMMSF